MAWSESESYIELRYHEDSKTERGIRCQAFDREHGFKAAHIALTNTENLLKAKDRIESGAERLPADDSYERFLNEENKKYMLNVHPGNDLPVEKEA